MAQFSRLSADSSEYAQCLGLLKGIAGEVQAVVPQDKEKEKERKESEVGVNMNMNMNMSGSTNSADYSTMFLKFAEMLQCGEVQIVNTTTQKKTSQATKENQSANKTSTLRRTSTAPIPPTTQPGTVPSKRTPVDAKARVSVSGRKSLVSK